MARIAIIGADSTNGSSTNLRTALLFSSAQHDCTLINQTQRLSLVDFDVIITTRVTEDAPVYADILAAFTSGVPVICGFTQGNTSSSPAGGVGSSHITGKIGLVAQTSQGLNDENSVRVIKDGFATGYNVGDVVSVHETGEIQGYALSSHFATGAVKYFDYKRLDTQVSVAIAGKGENSLMGTPFPASCAYAGFIYASNKSYNASGQKLLIDIIDKVIGLNDPKSISGFSTDENGNPVDSVVYLYSHSDGLLRGEMQTEADGSYQFFVGDGEYFIVCDDGDLNKNLKIYGRIQGAASV